ncbi:MAG: DNA polymerase I [Planctomycetaceae bacterium]|nr:MAG: DNA polymerase I [Planctomycetaceae bacterium]
MNPQPPTVYLLDTFSLIFQVFHAVAEMTGPHGQPTNAVFGLSRDLLNLLKNHRPDWLISAWESTAPSFRSAMYPLYKAQRTEMPQDLVPQLAPIKQVVAALGIPQVEHDGWEADDVIATLSRQAVQRGYRIVIVSNDKDLRQLLGSQVQIYNIRKDRFFDSQALLEDWGIAPHQVVDYQALVGDSVDNIPGVPQIGPRTASHLLQHYPHLEDIYAHLGDLPVSKRVRENLITYRDQAFLSRELARLRDDLSLDFDWESTYRPQPHVEQLQRVFREAGFRTLLAEARRLGRGSVAPVLLSDQTNSKSTLAPSITNDSPAISSPLTEKVDSPIPAEEQVASHVMEGGESVGSSLPRLTNRRWTIVNDQETWTRFLHACRQQTRICLDLETTHVDPRRAEIVGWACCWKEGEGWYIPVQGPPGCSMLAAEEVLRQFKSLLESGHVTLVNQNIKYDLIVLRSAGIFAAPQHDAVCNELEGHNWPSLGVDPMVADYLLDAGARSHNLETLAEKYLQVSCISITELIGSGKKQKQMHEVPLSTIAEYATEDAELGWRLSHLLEQELQRAGLADLYWKLEGPLITILAEMEYHGIRVDTAELHKQAEHVAQQLQALEQEIYQLSGHPFNIDSPLQLRKVLFEELKLPILKKTKTGPSTDQEVLEQLAWLHPLPAKISEHRQLTKLKGTYLDVLPRLVHPVTGRIHCSFHQTVAATGRLSSSEPNLQNIPIRTPAGRQIRQAFHADPGWKLVSADYSQIELRLLAHFSRDPALCAAFQKGEDIHISVASQVLSIPPDQITKEQRRIAKAVNFGVIYGQGPYGLAAGLGITPDQAAQFIEDYFARYAGVSHFLDELLNEVHQTRLARTILGRRRRVEGVRPADKRPRSRNLPERIAINTVIQGSAADLMKQAMVNLSARLRQLRHPARLLLQIHDELVFECPQCLVPAFSELVRQEMESALQLSVPLLVNISVGDNWLELDKEIEPPAVAPVE